MAASSTTAPVSETPSETRRCELWSRPPWAIDRPSSSRTTVTSVVSRIGTARTSTGSSSVTSVDDATVYADARPSAASRKPISCEPLSPIQESARLPGRRLNGRKPSSAASSATDMTRTSRDGWYHAAAIAKKPAEIAARLAASPSMLSSRLNAFVMPTSQRTPIAIAIRCTCTICTEVPVERTIAAAPSCAASFQRALSVQMSSTRPARKTSVAAAEMPISCSLARSGPTATASETPATRPM